jgi:23S rRNA-intervening sequence protein
LPVIEHTVTVYKIWYEYRENLPRKSRYTLGDKIDTLFLQLLELLFTASYQNKERKLSTLEIAQKKNDTLQFILRIAWEIHAVENGKYIALSTELHELGRMIGGWRKGLASKTPAQ